MSDLLKLYEKTNKLRPTQSKQIPELAVNMFDVTGQYQEGFTTFEKAGDPTNFTDKALKHYDTERSQIVIPTNFVPTEQGISLSRWNPDSPYFTTGQGS